MGTIKKGILGGFSGKVGIVVGASWKGIAYMRSLPQEVKNPHTLRQRMQRSKFALTLSLLKPMTAFLRTGWKLYAHKQSPFNAAMSYAINNAVIGTYPDYDIDPSKVLVSRSALPTSTNTFVSFDYGKVEFQWEGNSGVNSAKTTDKSQSSTLQKAKSLPTTQAQNAKIVYKRLPFLPNGLRQCRNLYGFHFRRR